MKITSLWKFFHGEVLYIAASVCLSDHPAWSAGSVTPALLSDATQADRPHVQWNGHCRTDYNLSAATRRKQKAASPERNAVIFAAMDHTARSTLLERRHLVQAYTWHGVPLTTALTRLTLGLTARLERLWEWETLIPKVTPLPQKSHFATCCTSSP